MLNLAVVTIVWALCLLTVVLGPPATLGLFYVANRLVHGQSLGISGLIIGVRSYFFKGWVWAVLNLAVFVTLAVSFRFYGQIDAIWARLLQASALTAALVWLAGQFYFPAYLMEQEEDEVKLALRNGLLTALASPGYTLVVLILCLFIVVFSLGLVIPVAFGVPALAALLVNRALLERLETFGLRERDD
jgi:hypothetical protein